MVAGLGPRGPKWTRLYMSAGGGGGYHEQTEWRIQLKRLPSHNYCIHQKERFCILKAFKNISVVKIDKKEKNILEVQLSGNDSYRREFDRLSDQQ